MTWPLTFGRLPDRMWWTSSIVVVALVKISNNNYRLPSQLNKILQENDFIAAKQFENKKPKCNSRKTSDIIFALNDWSSTDLNMQTTIEMFHFLVL